jgi:hypothetical protein
MTWLGKILTIVVMLGALVWAYLTIQAFVLRTNWKVERDKYKAAYEEAKAKRQDDYNRYLAGEEALRRQLAYAEARGEGLNAQVKNLSKTAGESAVATAKLQTIFDTSDVAAKQAQANAQGAISEAKAVRTRNIEIEDKAQALILAAENAKGEATLARNAQKLAEAIAGDSAKRIEELTNRVGELRAGGASGGVSPGVLGQLNKPPPPVLPNLRGEVTDVSGDLLTISIGIDAGLAVGTVLDIYRVEGGGRYLGTVRVTDAFNLYAKQAVVKFTPASRLPLERLSATDLPKKGDLVRPPEGPGR